MHISTENSLAFLAAELRMALTADEHILALDAKSSVSNSYCTMV
jgi:hypothetical protein